MAPPVVGAAPTCRCSVHGLWMLRICSVPPQTMYGGRIRQSGGWTHACVVCMRVLRAFTDGDGLCIDGYFCDIQKKDVSLHRR